MRGSFEIEPPDGGAGDIGNSIRPAAHTHPVGEHQGEDLLKRDRDHGEIVTGEFERGRAEHDAEEAGDEDAPDRCHREGKMQHDGAQREPVGAEPEEGCLGDVDLSGKAQHHRHAEYADRVSEGLHQEVGDVAVEGHGEDQREQDEKARGPGEDGAEGSGAHVRPSPQFFRRRTLAGEEAGRGRAGGRRRRPCTAPKRNRRRASRPRRW